MEDPTKPPPTEYSIGLPDRPEFQDRAVWDAAKAHLQAKFPHLKFSVGRLVELVTDAEFLIMPVMANMVDGGRVIPIASRDRATELEILLELRRFDPAARKPLH